MPDDKILSLKPKLKPALPLQMQQSLQEQQSSGSVEEDIFPSNTSAFQKERISEKISSFANQFAIFKRNLTSQTGIGAQRQ